MRLLKAVFLFGGFLLAHFTLAEEINYRGLQHLVGTWKISSPKSEWEESFRLTYRFISRDTALVEVYGDPQKQTTETIYHADGSNLMATHYCARGNQPRLKVKEARNKNILVFDFLDVTNLAHKTDPHMINMKFTFIDKDHFEKEEVYLVKGKEESSTMSLVRER